MGFVGALQYIIGEGTCWLWIWCLPCNPVVCCLFWPDHMFTVPFRNWWDIARGPKSSSFPSI